MKFHIRGGVEMPKAFFAEENIEYFGVLPFSSCRLCRPYMIERLGVLPEQVKSAILFLIPYYVNDGEGNLSLYARSGDYHAYAERLFERLLPKLEARFGGRFLGFADKSPIEETHAALMAGLGCLGDNALLINETYGSFVFIAEILSTVTPEMLGYDKRIASPAFCSHCGACKRACPMVLDGMECLSSLTQKKGALSEEQARYLKKYGCAWGCDRCQLVCPLNQRVLSEGRETPIEFFHQDRIATLTADTLRDMNEDAFRARAFSWRGKETLLRNLEILSH